MIINTIYTSYQGEVNIFGIGAPVIFVRTGGCHLRCYKDTLGELCDTPEALEKGSGTEMRIDEIEAKLLELKERTGITLICLSGGDPLWRRVEELIAFFAMTHRNGFYVSVETSGTLSIRELLSMPTVSWVLDYKSISAGVKQNFMWSNVPFLRKGKDFIKFVLYDSADYLEFYNVLPRLLEETKATIAVGTYWGGKLSYGQLVKKLTDDRIIGDVVINMQAHKLLTYYDLTIHEASKTQIPTEI